MSHVSILDDRAVLRIAGPSAAPFLQGLITQDMAAVETGLAFAALLTPQGKIAAEFILAKEGEGYLLDCAAAIADAFLKRLSLYRLRAAIDLERLHNFAVIAAPDADALLLDRGFRPDPRLAALGSRAIAPRIAASGMTRETGGAYDARRIALGVPELGKDFGPDEMFLLDVNADALGGVSYRKGCFVGQEVTSRMKRKGEIRKRTMIARFEGAPPPKGAAILAGPSTLGEMLTGTEGAALAAIRLDRLDAARQKGETLMAGGVPLSLHLPDYLKQS